MAQQPAIIGLGTANPAQRYSQQEIYDFLCRDSPFYRTERIHQIFMNSDIDFRHLYLDIDSTNVFESRDQLHERFRRGSVEIGKKAILKCLEASRLDVSDIDCIIAVSCTGYLCPGLTSLFIKELNLRTNIQRADLLGMGCGGAMPGLQRAHDFVMAYPSKNALVVAVEICSACYYIDETLETVVGNAICSDGAAAAVIGMKAGDVMPKICGFETILEPSLINAVGFEHRDGRLRIVLSKDIRDIAGSLGQKLISRLLDSFHLKPADVEHWILHSGGRKVIDNLQKELSLSDEDMRHSRSTLRSFGNMSSPTVLFVLHEAMKNAQVRSGSYGVMLAMGPGLALDACLLQW